MNETASKRELIRAPQERAIDFTTMPAAVALPILARELKELAERMPLVRDLTCELRIDANGSCALHFRAC